MYEVYIGQELLCLNGEKVIVKFITRNEIIFGYKNKLYRRPKSIIGQKLFNKDIKKVPKAEESFPKSPRNIKYSKKFLQSQQAGDREYTCRDCIFYKREDCFGEKEMCDRFKKVPVANKSITDNWPRMGTASYYRIINSRKRRY